MGLHDLLAGELHVFSEIVINHGGKVTGFEEFAIIAIEIVRDEHFAGMLKIGKGLADRSVTATD